MRWLELSSKKFEPISDISFSIKKPLFAASVVLSYSRERGHAELRAKIPFKGDMHYAVDASSRDVHSSAAITSIRPGAGAALFAFSNVQERDEIKNQGRSISSGDTSYTIVPIGDETARERTVYVVNDSPSRLFHPIQLLPAFSQTHSKEREDVLYGAYFILGRHIEALRLERLSDSSAAETFEIRTMRVPRMLGENEFIALPWSARAAYEFDYDVERKSLTAARFNVPIIGKLEIRA